MIIKKIKDFIYNTNDILIAVIILALAVAVIGWRMGIIMEYPKTIFNEGDSYVDDISDSDLDDIDDSDSDSDEADDSDQDDSDADAKGDDDGDAEGDDHSEGNQNGDKDKDNDKPSQSGKLWDEDKLARDVEVNVTGTSATAAISCLVDAGLFEDYDEYKKICGENGMDHEKVSAGLLTFPKGSTKLDIADQINWSN